MPFRALPCHVGVWKGMEGHRYMKGHFIREGHALPNRTKCLEGPALLKGILLWKGNHWILNNSSVSITLCAEDVWPSSETKVTSCNSWAFPTLPSICVMHIN